MGLAGPSDEALRVQGSRPPRGAPGPQSYLRPADFGVEASMTNSLALAILASKIVEKFWWIMKCYTSSEGV